MRSLKIALANPFASTTRGNNVTAERWKGIFRQLGHEVSEDNPDVLVALHARHSHSAIVEFKRRNPTNPIVLALTGTDIYRDIAVNEKARESLRLADRLVVLQDQGLAEVGTALREKTRVITQSCPPPASRPPRREDCFEVALIGHLREVKDPLLAPAALRLLPEGSPVVVTHAGEAFDEVMAGRAEEETAANPRYDWIGGVSLEESIGIIARSRLLLLTSHMEGGANAATEALACGTPIVSSRVKGLIGLMGADFPGFFPVGNATALAELLHKAAADPQFYAQLEAHTRSRAHLADPDLEKRNWQALLAELS